MYNDPRCKPWTSSKWCPPGATSRAGVREMEKEEKTAASVADEGWNSSTPVDRRSDEEADPSNVNVKFAKKNQIKTEDA